MSEPKQPQGKQVPQQKEVSQKEVYCHRVKRSLPVAEHATCPYCYGKPSAIETAEHPKFCDFEEGKDPINFGFPQR